jgi:hypothetical protein
MTESACLVCGKSFLAALKSTEQPLLVLPLVGDVGAMSRGHRLGLAAGAVLLLLIPLALITLLMTGKAPQAPLDQTPSPSPTVLHTEPAGTPAVQ